MTATREVVEWIHGCESSYRNHCTAVSHINTDSGFIAGTKVTHPTFTAVGTLSIHTQAQLHDGKATFTAVGTLSIHTQARLHDGKAEGLVSKVTCTRLGIERWYIGEYNRGWSSTAVAVLIQVKVEDLHLSLTAACTMHTYAILNYIIGIGQQQ